MSIPCEECMDCRDLVRDAEVENCSDCHGFLCPQCINEYEDLEEDEMLSLCIVCYNKRVGAKK